MNFFNTDNVQVLTNPQNRCPCILLLDVSTSMQGNKINQLNEGLHTFKTALLQDEVAAARVELAIITFGAEVKLLQDFHSVDAFIPPTLVANGETPLGQAVELALDTLQNRKNLYKANGISYYRPWLFLITDGAPTDPWQNAAQRVKSQEARKKIAFFCVGVQGANMEMLNQISSRIPVKLQGVQFKDMFEWLSASLARVSQSNIGDEVPLERPDWTAV